MFYLRFSRMLQHSTPFLGLLNAGTKTQVFLVAPSNLYMCLKLSRNSCLLFTRPYSYSCSGRIRHIHKYCGVFSRPSLFWQHSKHNSFRTPVSFYCTKKEKSSAYEESSNTKTFTPTEPTSSSKQESQITTDNKLSEELWQKEEKNVSIFQKFKRMYRDYWYVLVPVHVVTSLGWFGGFYYLAVSGVDIVALLEYSGVSNTILDPLRDSSAGYIAVAYALYKIATPFRYMVTIGGTTISINYLKEHGYIKPIPPKEKLKEIYQEKKDNLIEKRQNFAHGIKQKREQLKERRESFMRERRDRTKK